MELLFALLVLILNIWAIWKIIASGAGTGAKVIWVLLILFMPVLGFLIWLIFGPKGSERTAV